MNNEHRAYLNVNFYLEWLGVANQCTAAVEMIEIMQADAQLKKY